MRPAAPWGICAAALFAGLALSSCNLVESKLRIPGRPVFLSDAWKEHRKLQRAEAQRLRERRNLEEFVEVMVHNHPHLYPP